MGKNKFYMYVLLDQRKKGTWSFNEHIFEYQPFYVGIGVGYRMTSHFTPYNLKQKNIKNNIIKKILSECNELPITRKIIKDVDENTVKELEVNFIKHFGKLKTKTGILSNLTDGGDGIRGFNHSEKYKQSLRKKVYQYNLDGEFLKEWSSLKEVTTFFKTEGSGGLRHSMNSENSHFKGFIWRYVKYESLELSQNFKNKPLHVYGIIKDGEEFYFKNDDHIREFFGQNFSRGNVSSCIKGKIKTYFGYKWIWKKIKD